MTVLFTDPLFLEHKTGAHPETADRLRAITARIDGDGLSAQCRRGTIVPIVPEAAMTVHDSRVVERVRRLAEGGGGALDSETIVSPQSFQVALAAAGAAVSAVDAVLDGDDPTALCLVRPPGHHANATTSMGFCLLNSIAIAAYHARLILDRVMIVDFDVHHGNGTQDVFYRDPSVVFLSLHRYGDGFYPGTGAATETGTGPGLGATQNVAVEFGTNRTEILGQFRNTLERAADAAKPQLILVSAGFDAHRLDPIGNLALETEDFRTVTECIKIVAKTHCGGRIVSCLEGGYHLAATADGVHTHLSSLLNHD